MTTTGTSTGTSCTCWIEEGHLRDLAELLTEDDYDAVLATPTDERSWQLQVSGGRKVPYWEQNDQWIIQCRPADSAEVWEYSYDTGELIGDTEDKLRVLFRIKAHIHGIDLERA